MEPGIQIQNLPAPQRQTADIMIGHNGGYMTNGITKAYIIIGEPVAGTASNGI